MRFDGTFPSFRLVNTTCEDLLLVLERLMFVTFKLNPFTYLYSSCFLTSPSLFFVNNFSFGKHYGYFSHNFSSGSFQQLYGFPLAIMLSAIMNEIGLITGIFFILKPNGIISFSNAIL